MARRLSNTAAITERPYEAGEDHSVSVRKIENGYLTRTATCNPNTGSYRSSEVFTKTPPRITPPSMDAGQGEEMVGSQTLGDTMRYLKEDK